MAGLLSGYSSTIAETMSKKRYAEKLQLVNDIDSYQIEGQLARRRGLVACNYATSEVYVPHPSSDQVYWTTTRNVYKDGWQVLVKPVRDKQIMIGKASLNCANYTPVIRK